MENYSYNKRKVGLTPGTIFYTGDKADKNINMELYSCLLYTSDAADEL